MRIVSTFVLPVPGPAITITGPSSVSTASFCSGFNNLYRSSNADIMVCFVYNYDRIVLLKQNMARPIDKLRSYWDRASAATTVSSSSRPSSISASSDFFSSSTKRRIRRTNFSFSRSSSRSSSARAKHFLKDWTPPILLSSIYEYLRTLIPKINPHVHYYFDAKVRHIYFWRPTADRLAPTRALQSRLSPLVRLRERIPL